VFIDDRLSGEFLTGNNPSGTVNFSYKPFVKLSAGEHTIYTTASDSRGKESIWSNIVYYKVLLDIPTISNKAVSEKMPENNSVISDKAALIGDDNKEAVPNESKEESAGANAEIKEILEAGNNSSSMENNGLVDESNEKQGAVRLNLVIFILFLLAVIAWIFWVNRELIKEKREQNIKD
jgi:hypothetical protein